MDEVGARQVVSQYGHRLDVERHGNLVAAAAARVADLNQEMGNLMAMVRLVEAELIALHQLALWAQRDAGPVELGAVTDQAVHTLY